MNAAAFFMLFAAVFVAVAVTEAATYFGQPFAMPRKRSSYVDDAQEKRATYLGFPRLGRGYLALPRMGRSQAGSDTSSSSSSSSSGGDGAPCCTTGLKKEWVFGEEGKMKGQDVCQARACCQDFMEVQGSKADGTFYTMCIPRAGAQSTNLDAASDNVMLKLQRLLRN